MPGKILSFWHLVGNPSKQFRKSRTIRNGAVTEEAGGGLCQASGIIYLASLLTNLQIIERHNHSIDLYTDETRFAPLGSDATVVYGYKDLRIQNNYHFPIKFELCVFDNKLRLTLLSTEKIDKNPIEFKIRYFADKKTVETISLAGVLNISTYTLR